MSLRKKYQTPDLFSLLTRLPWWVHLGLAGACYYLLVAFVPALELQNPVAARLLALAPLFAWFFVPFFVLTGVASCLRGWSRRRLLAKNRDIEAIRALEWDSFERLVGEAFRGLGFQVGENERAGSDGGIDLVLNRAGTVSLVQCKNWRNNSVGVAIVREMFGVMVAYPACRVYIVSSGHFTQDALEFARDKPITLINGEQLVALVLSVTDGAPVGGKDALLPAEVSAPPCPECGTLMLKRVARRGKNPGQSFWGCANYPTCRGARRLPEHSLTGT